MVLLSQGCVPFPQMRRLWSRGTQQPAPIMYQPV